MSRYLHHAKAGSCKYGTAQLSPAVYSTVVAFGFGGFAFIFFQPFFKPFGHN